MRSLATGLWVAEQSFKASPLGLNVDTRMTVIRLTNGGLFLHSPIKMDAETRHALDSIGPVRAVVAPNRVHHLFVADYVTAYPKARIYAAPGLPEKRRDLPFDGVLSDSAPDEWRGDLEQHLFRGATRWCSCSLRPGHCCSRI